MTDERRESTAPGADDDTPPVGPPDAVPPRDDLPVERRPDPDEPLRSDSTGEAHTPEDAAENHDGEARAGVPHRPGAAAEVPDNDDLYADERDGAVGYPGAEAQDAGAAEEEPEGRRRPPLAVIISSVILLVAIGAGLAFIIPSGPVREVDQLIPTAPAAPSADPAAIPTALPLPEAIPGDSNEVIARVGEGSILRGDFVRLYQPGVSPDDLLNQLIQVELVVQAASTEGVTADPEMVAEQIEQIKQSQAGGDQALFESFLEQARIGNEENLRRLLERDQVVEQMILRHTTAEQVRARHILVATDAMTDTVARAEADALLQQLDDGADFATLAAEHSDDEGSKANGGDLGWALRGLFVPEFDEAVFNMAVGERRLVQTQFGWHIIEVLEAPEVRQLESADLLQSPPGQQAFAETFIPWVDELKRQADEANAITILVPAASLVTTPAP